MNLTNIRLPSELITEPQPSSYEALADHYYDQVLHPTCHALRAGSRQIVSELLTGQKFGGSVVELGAGKAIVPECIPEWRSRFDAIVLVDSSGSMLDHSRNLAKDRVTLLIEDAIGTSIPDASANLVIASLGDPYNGPSLWIELGRMMAPGAMAIFTTPSADWAELFRRDGQLAPIDSAEFISDDGRLVYVPSVILREDEQCEMIRLAGLVPDKVVWRCVSDVNEAALAPKLRLLGPAEPYVTGYRVLKPKG